GERARFPRAPLDRAQPGVGDQYAGGVRAADQAGSRDRRAGGEGIGPDPAVMMMNRDFDRPACSLTACVLVLLGGLAVAHAQDYPARPIKAIVPLSAGGTSDIFMRALGEELRKRWGQPLVVENRPGGNTNIAGKACAEAPNDGYTICILPGETL